MNNINSKLFYDEQIDFKHFVCDLLNLDDCFYFDSVYGVDDANNKHIKGLVCNGTITWKKAINIIKKHFSK